MEFLTFLAVLAILILLVINISKVNGQLKSIFKEVENLRNIIAKLENSQHKNTVAEEKPLNQKAETLVTENHVVQSLKSPEPTVQTPFATSYDDTVKAKMEALNREKAIYEARPKPIKPPKQPTDFEKFVGENLISKLGIVILVLGIGFFVKYAIDQNWIGVYGRTAIGILTGGILVSLAFYLRKSFKTFSSLLTGGGFAVFYLTIAIAFHQYHIFSQAVAMIIMVVITIFSVLLSLAYDKKELAVFSQFGGYAAPFMVATGEGNYIVLFSYMLILNTGLLVLAYYKRWHVLNLVAFIFTVLIFSGWLATNFWDSKSIPFPGALLFATAFYSVFFLVNILNNLKERTPFKVPEIMMILSNNLFYFLWGIAILYNYEKGIYKGLFTIAAALFNFGWVLYLYRKKQVDKNLIFLLIGLVMSYISLAIPIQLNGHSITLFWTAELVILLWLWQVTRIRILKTGHLIILVLVLFSLMMDWGNNYNVYLPKPVIFNSVFITGLFVIAGLSASLLFLKKESETVFVQNIVKTEAYKNIIRFVLFATCFIVPFLEIIYQTRNYSYMLQTVIAMTYIFAYLFVSLIITKKIIQKQGFRIVFIISWIALLFYLLLFNWNVINMRSVLAYGTTVSNNNFLFHFTALPFVVGMLLVMYKNQTVVLPETTLFSKIFKWFAIFIMVFLASTELDHILIFLSEKRAENYYYILQLSHKVGYPILWGIFAFVLISLGIKYKTKLFWIQALCLFALIILKLFLFDVWNMSEGGRIAAFVFLGVVLLVVSFLYQKLKNLLLEPGKINSTLEP